VEPLRGTTYFELAGLEIELAELLGVKIEIATPGGLRPDFAERIASDLKPI
jgi:uncharacterized protein